MKGKRIGVTKKSVGEFFLGRFLNSEGLSAQDVEIVDFNPSNIIDAVVNGELDAGFTWEPNISEIKRQLGGDAISWPGQLDQEFYFILLATREWVRTEPMLSERFLRAVTQAEEFALKNPEKVQQFLEDRFNYDQSYVAKMWPNLQFTVSFPQDLLLVMEDQASWRISSGLEDHTTVPNYLSYIYLDALEASNPEAIAIIR